MRYLAIDVGTKTCGVAISDKTNVLATPYKLINYLKDDYLTLARELKNIIKEESITDLIVGYPINMDGSHGFATKRVDTLVSYLKDININIHYIDERLTTVDSINILHNVGKTTKTGKNVVDIISAVLILESYLKGINNE